MIADISRRTAGMVGAAACAAGLATALVVATDTRVIAAGGHDTQVAVGTAAATIGALLAFLVQGRFRQTGLVRDALLGAALLVLAAGNALLGVLPVVLGSERPLTAAAAVAGLVSGALLVLAAWLPERVLDGSVRRRVPVVAVLSVGTLLAGCWGLSLLLPETAPGSTGTFGATPNRVVTATQLCAAAAFLAAAVGWSRVARDSDALAAPVAVATVLGGLSRADFAVASFPDSPWVTAGTLLRIAFYVTLLAASVLEIRGYWQRVGEAAVLEERRRMARDLHDGLAQELAFAATQARALAECSEHPTRARLIAAATERALDECRRAIAALTRPLDEPIEVAVAQCAEEVCGRYQASLVLDVQPGVTAAPEVREALLRIVREAVSNAVRHGQAGSVTVRLAGPRPVRLSIEDDGSGFDIDDRRHLSGRFGLVSMRERAEGLGGSFALVSRTPGGTSVEVVLP